MATRAVVAAVVVLAAVAATDAFRDRDGDPPAVAPAHPTARLLVRPVHDAEARRSPPALGAIHAAFPGSEAGRTRVLHVAAAPDGMLAFGIVRSGQGAVELWYARSLIAAFRVPLVSLAGGFGFSGDGSIVATYTADGRPALYDRRGRHVPANALRAF